MSENYKWVQNRKCEFFPCHKGVKEEDFNCLFCYCPLYMLKDKCGGNYKNTNGYKDCSDCILPHRRSGYDFVMKKMGMVMEVGKGTFVITDNGNVCTKAEDANDSSDVICSEAEKDCLAFLSRGRGLMVQAPQKNPATQLPGSNQSYALREYPEGKVQNGLKESC